MATIQHLMAGIHNLDYVLPEFQREYVWELEQAKQLMVSLCRDYPTGSLLVWRTSNPPEIKNSAVNRETMGTTQVVLDGQQRLTTLYLLTQNAVPPYYTEEDIRNNPRDLYFDLATGEFEYFQPMKMRNSPNWRPVTECFNGNINLFELVEECIDDAEQRGECFERFNGHLNTLKTILTKDYPIQFVPETAGIEDAIDVFDRVNSQGTKLSKAELGLAHACGKWPEARRIMKEQIERYAQQRFYFDLTFMMRSLTAVVRERALFETIHNATREELEEGWKRLIKRLDYLLGILPQHAYIHSTEDLTSLNVLVPLVAYLAQRGTFHSEAEIRRAIHWLYAANTKARYSGQTDQRLDHDLSIVRRERSPWKGLVDAIIEQRGSIKVKPGEFDGRTTQHPLYRMTHILVKSRGAIDWFNGHPLHQRPDGKDVIHNHHIFPLSQLYGDDGQYDSGNHLHKKIVNEIANRAFLTAATNIEMSNQLPEDYLPGILARYPGVLDKQFIPTDPTLWRMANYEAFIQKRRELIATAFNDLMQSLLEDVDERHELTVEEMIADGESSVLEFKSSLRWDVRQGKVNTALQKVVAKTVAGFMNSENGGTLLIGVADDGAIMGIEDDIASTSRHNLDGFQQTLYQTLSNRLGAPAAASVTTTFEQVGDHQVCQVHIPPSQTPVFLEDGNNQDFFIRVGPATQPLNVQDTHQYIADRWQ